MGFEREDVPPLRPEILATRRSDAGSQVIVCREVTAKQNDHDELVPMVGARDTTFSLHGA